jgi:hypothetical protein
MAWFRLGTCNHCGDCCGGNNQLATSLGYETLGDNIDDIAESHNLWTLFGLGFNPVTEVVEPENLTGSVRIKGTQYPFEWVEPIPGRGTQPLKPGTVECPFLEPDPGDGSRPCALVGSQDEGARQKFCRPEERPEYVLRFVKWLDRHRTQWEQDHPNCSYIWEFTPDPEF